MGVIKITKQEYLYLHNKDIGKYHEAIRSMPDGSCALELSELAAKEFVVILSRIQATSGFDMQYTLNQQGRLIDDLIHKVSSIFLKN